MIIGGTPEQLAEIGIAPTTVIRLPMPPSVNDMYFNNKNARGRGRVPSKLYEKWKIDAGWELKAQHVKPTEGQVHIKIDLDDTRRGDADNRAKPVLDLLVSHGIIKNDSKKFVQRVSIGWEAVSGCRVSIQQV